MKSIRLIFLSACMIACLSLVGCGQDKQQQPMTMAAPQSEEVSTIPTTTVMVPYTNKKQSFMVEYSNQWQQQDTMDEESIILENTDLHATLKVQRYHKEILSLQNITSMSSFVDLHHQASIGALLTLAKDRTDLDLVVDNPAVLSCRAEEFSYVKDNENAKCYLAYLETNDSFYAVLITSPEGPYNKFINAWNLVVTSLEEYEPGTAPAEPYVAPVEDAKDGADKDKAKNTK